MKVIPYCLFFLITVTFTTVAYAQETSTNNRNLSPEAEIRYNLRRWGSYQDAYLFQLNEEQRKIIFYNHFSVKNELEEIRDSFVKNQEERFQKIKQKYDAMTDDQRDSIITTMKENANKNGEIIDVKKVLLDEDAFLDIRINKVIMRELLDIFSGQPAYIMITKQKIPDGKTMVLSKAIVYHKNLQLIYGIGRLRRN